MGGTEIVYGHIFLEEYVGALLQTGMDCSSSNATPISSIILTHTHTHTHTHSLSLSLSPGTVVPEDARVLHGNIAWLRMAGE